MTFDATSGFRVVGRIDTVDEPLSSTVWECDTCSALVLDAGREKHWQHHAGGSAS